MSGIYTLCIIISICNMALIIQLNGINNTLRQINETLYKENKDADN